MHACALRTASSRPVPSHCTPGTIAFCGRGKAYLHTHGIIQFARCTLYPDDRALANARDYYRRALRRGVAVRRLMENALLSLIAVLRLPTIQSPPLYLRRTARVEDLTRAFSRVRKDLKRGDNWSHLIAPRDTAA